MRHASITWAMQSNGIAQRSRVIPPRTTARSPIGETLHGLLSRPLGVTWRVCEQRSRSSRRLLYDQTTVSSLTSSVETCV